MPTNDKLAPEGNPNNYDVAKTMLPTLQDTKRTDDHTHSGNHSDNPTNGTANTAATDESEDDADDNKQTKTATQQQKDIPVATMVKQSTGTDACNVGAEAAGGDVSPFASSLQLKCSGCRCRVCCSQVPTRQRSALMRERWSAVGPSESESNSIVSTKRICCSLNAFQKWA